MLEWSGWPLARVQADDSARIVVPLREEPGLIEAPIPCSRVVGKQQQQHARFNKPIFDPFVPVGPLGHLLRHMKDQTTSGIYLHYLFNMLCQARIFGLVADKYLDTVARLRRDGR